MNSQEFQPGTIVKVKDAVERMRGAYLNDILARVNDHVIRVSVMTNLISGTDTPSLMKLSSC
jgi:hypothetical protein